MLNNNITVVVIAFSYETREDVDPVLTYYAAVRSNRVLTFWGVLNQQFTARKMLFLLPPNFFHEASCFHLSMEWTPCTNSGDYSPEYPSHNEFWQISNCRNY